MTQYEFDPATYLDLMRHEVPAYGRLQEAVAEATGGLSVSSVLDLGTGTGETLAAVLARHPGASAVGVDKNEAMLGAARRGRAGVPVELRVAELTDPFPPARSISSSRRWRSTTWRDRTRRPCSPASAPCWVPAGASSSATW